MADEGQVIRGINWRSTFPFVNIFRSFRVAIHMSKLALGLALLLAVYFGGQILDSAWPVRSRAVPGEVEQYERLTSGQADGNLADWRKSQQDATDAWYTTQLLNYNLVPKASDTEPPVDTHNRALAEAQKRHYVGDVQAHILQDRDDHVAQINKDYQAAVDAINKSDATDAEKTDAKSIAKKGHDDSVRSAYDEASESYRHVEEVRGLGLFDVFFAYEVNQVNGVVKAAVRNDWISPANMATFTGGSVTSHIYNFFAVAPIWLIWHHAVFFIVYAIYFLLIWALFGGAISRIAAVHIARDEKISVRQAMNFAVGKLLSFASAPVIPIVIVLVIGLFASLASLILGNIPYLGSVLVGGLFILALLAGFVMTLVLLGTAGGFNLMYPTIAVEGSDSFDAISRSFSYVYARPWRMLFYTAVAIFYGAATYMFVHLFLLMMLVLTHHFVGMGMFGTAASTRDLFSTMWPNPAMTGRLSYAVDYTALGGADKVGAFFLHCWVMLLVFFLGAFAISLYFSSNTIIYYLMRSEVDATEMDDVYLEQSEDEMEAAPLTGAVMTTVTSTTIVSGDPIPPAPGGDSSSPDEPIAPPPSPPAT